MWHSLCSERANKSAVLDTVCAWMYENAFVYVLSCILRVHCHETSWPDARTLVLRLFTLTATLSCCVSKAVGIMLTLTSLLGPDGICWYFSALILGWWMLIRLAKILNKQTSRGYINDYQSVLNKWVWFYHMQNKIMDSHCQRSDLNAKLDLCTLWTKP